MSQMVAPGGFYDACRESLRRCIERLSKLRLLLVQFADITSTVERVATHVRRIPTLMPISARATAADALLRLAGDMLTTIRESFVGEMADAEHANQRLPHLRSFFDAVRDVVEAEEWSPLAQRDRCSCYDQLRKCAMADFDERPVPSDLSPLGPAGEPAQSCM